MEFIAYLLMFLFIAVAIIVISRELACWYFKINIQIEQKKKIINLLSEIKNLVNK